MSTAVKIQNANSAPVAAMPAPSASLDAMLWAMRSGIPTIARDLTSERVQEARAIVAAGCGPADPRVVLSWLTNLAATIVNAPVFENAPEKVSAILEVCEDLPAGVWTRETRLAWVRQGERGKFWPAPAELYAHLRPYADRITRQFEGCQRIVRMAEQQIRTKSREV